MLLTESKSAKSPAVKISSVLIDPFKQCLLRLIVNWADLFDIHALVDCDLMQAVPYGHDHLIWIDESGLLREPFIYPQFKVKGANGDCPLTGYGLITGITRPYGELKDCTIHPDALPIVFESWQRRINPDNCIEQLLRCYYDR